MPTTILTPRYSIPYRIEYIQIAGSPMGALLFQQLEYWSARYKSGFYKFLAVPKKFHPKYRAKDSWTEELGISEKVFRKAFDKIGIRYRSKSEYSASENPFICDGQEFCFCSYYDKITHTTYYRRNHAFANRVLRELSGEVLQDAPEAPNNAELPDEPLGKCPEGGSSLYTETTSENNNNTPAPENADNQAEIAVKPPEEVEAVVVSETRVAVADKVLGTNNVHFKSLNRYEVPAAQKILQAIDLSSQKSVMLVLEAALKNSSIKNTLGYLKALVQSVQNQNFMPLTTDKSEKFQGSRAPETDIADFNVKAYALELQAKCRKNRKKRKVHNPDAKNFFQGFKPQGA